MKNENRQTHRASILSFIALTALALSFIATVSVAETPSPRPADLKKPVKIHLLSGQSNMSGRRYLGNLRLKTPAAEQKASLFRFIMEPQNVEKYKFLCKEGARKNRTWTVRDDVFITMGDWPKTATAAMCMPTCAANSMAAR